MNTLERVVLDQYDRVVANQGDQRQVLDEAKDEILAESTPDLILEIINDPRCIPEHETRTSRAQMRAFQDEHSITNRSVSPIRTAHGLARIGMIQEGQGYAGGIIREHGELQVFGSSMLFNRLKQVDPIQEAMGEIPYPAMMWAKALRAVAYEHRPESAESLSVPVYLSKLGLSLGCNVTQYGDAVGATGFMPDSRLAGLEDEPIIGGHIASEETEAFRLSGLCDQAVVDPDILLATRDFAHEILSMGGSLN